MFFAHGILHQLKLPRTFHRHPKAHLDAGSVVRRVDFQTRSDADRRDTHRQTVAISPSKIGTCKIKTERLHYIPLSITVVGATKECDALVTRSPPEITRSGLDKPTDGTRGANRRQTVFERSQPLALDLAKVARIGSCPGLQGLSDEWFLVAQPVGPAD